jgi:hypothetical protein
MDNKEKLKQLIKKYVREAIVDIIVDEPELISEALRSHSRDSVEPNAPRIYESNSEGSNYKSVRMMNEALYGDKNNLVDPEFSPRISQRARVSAAGDAKALLEMIKTTNSKEESARVKNFMTEKKRMEASAEKIKINAIANKAKKIFGEDSYLFEALMSGPEFITDENALMGASMPEEAVEDSSFEEFANMTNDLFEAAAFGSKGSLDKHVDLDNFGNFVEKNKKTSPNDSPLMSESRNLSNRKVVNGVILPEGYEVTEESFVFDQGDDMSMINESYSEDYGDVDFMAMPSEESTSLPREQSRVSAKKATVVEDTSAKGKTKPKTASKPRGRKPKTDEVTQKINNNELKRDVSELDFVPAPGDTSDILVEPSQD